MDEARSEPLFGSRAGRIIAGAVVGTLLEGYDFAVYGFMLGRIADTFFPSGDAFASLLSAAATFGASFLMRPVGAVLLGGLADRAGRRTGLSVAVALMGVGTAVVALTPGVRTIGAAAPWIFVSGRLLQGFSAGGEFGGANCVLLEHSPRGAGGGTGSLLQLSQGLSLILGSLAAAAADMLPGGSGSAWGWRLPFLLGLLIVPAGAWLRAALPDDAPAGGRTPLTTALKSHRGAVVTGAGLVTTATVGLYVFLVYMPTFATRQLGVAPGAALASNAAGVALFILSARIAGGWSDRVGRRLPMMLSALAIVATAYPMFALLAAVHRPATLCGVQAVAGVLVGAYSGPMAAAVGELFPAAARGLGASVAYNAAVVSFGGFAPLVTAWLVEVSGAKPAPALYVMLAAGIGAASLRLHGRTARRNERPCAEGR